MRRSLPVYPDKQTFSVTLGMSQRCHKRKWKPFDEGVVDMTMAEAVQSFRDRFPFYQRILSALEIDQVTFGLELSRILTGEASRVVGAALTSITVIILRVMKETISEHNALTR